MRRLVEWIEARVQRMREGNDAIRVRIIRRQLLPEMEVKPPAQRGWKRAAAHRSRSQVRR